MVKIADLLRSHPAFTVIRAAWLLIVLSMSLVHCIVPLVQTLEKPDRDGVGLQHPS